MYSLSLPKKTLKRMQNQPRCLYIIMASVFLLLSQFLTTLNCGVLQENLYDLSENSKRKLILPEAYTKFKPIPFRASTSLFYPTCTLNVAEEKEEGGLYNEDLNDEMDWLDSVCFSNIYTWSLRSKHHPVKVSSDNLIPGVNSVMTPIKKTLHQLKPSITVW